MKAAKNGCLEAVKLLLLDHTSQYHVDTTLEVGQYFEDVFTHISKWIKNHPRQNSCEVLEVMEKRKIKMIEKRKSKLSKGRRRRSTPSTAKTSSSTNGIKTSPPFLLPSLLGSSTNRAELNASSEFANCSNLTETSPPISSSVKYRSLSSIPVR